MAQHSYVADLDANANRPVACVRPACCLHWVVVDVDDLVQVPGHLLCDLCQLVKVKVPACTHAML